MELCAEEERLGHGDSGAVVPHIHGSSLLNVVLLRQAVGKPQRRQPNFPGGLPDGRPGGKIPESLKMP